MKNISRYPALVGISLLVLATLVPSASANPGPSRSQSNASTSTSNAAQLEVPQQSQQNRAIVVKPERSLPTFGIKNESKKSGGILSVLGGRFKDEDRHPSFREIPRPSS